MKHISPCNNPDSQNRLYNTYRTKDGEGYFKFRFVKIRRAFEIDVLSINGKRLSHFSMLNSRLISSERENHQICNGRIFSYNDALEYCEKWAESNWQLIRNDQKESHDPLSDKSSSILQEREKRDAKMVFEYNPYQQIISTVGKLQAETGGILLGYRTDYIVRKFIFDEAGSRSAGGYDPDVTFLNSVIKKEWKDNHLALIGFVHSHPRGVSRLSGDWGNGIGDIGYLKRIFQYIPALEKFLVPIVYTRADGGELRIFPYIAWKDSVEKYYEGKLEISEATGYSFDKRKEYSEITSEKSENLSNPVVTCNV